jgi:hypothetical protein
VTSCEVMYPCLSCPQSCPDAPLTTVYVKFNGSKLIGFEIITQAGIDN